MADGLRRAPEGLGQAAEGIGDRSVERGAALLEGEVAGVGLEAPVQHRQGVLRGVDGGGEVGQQAESGQAARRRDRVILAQQPGQLLAGQPITAHLAHEQGQQRIRARRRPRQDLRLGEALLVSP